MALCCYEVMPEAFTFFDEVPDKLKYDFAIQAYMHHGDQIPRVREAVRRARRYGKPTFPAELDGVEVFTVYRAGEEPINKAKYRISWTLSEAVALFFLREYGGRHASNLYRAKIRREKVIAYTNERKEEEIMQYRNVFDIEDITGNYQ